jgi:DNA polymerase elongation subunit (family B)
MIAYNIDYSTCVKSEAVDDKYCHIIEWSTHVNCKHDAIYDEKTCICEDYKYRFLKQEYGMGVLPTIIQNLLDARKKTRALMKDLYKDINEMKDPDEIVKTKEFIKVLNTRQLSLKVSANSMYGAMGVPDDKGYLPFKTGARSVTAKGRENLLKAEKYLQREYGCRVIYEDTDSCYTTFPTVTDPVELWKLAEQIEQDLIDNKVFPPPMKLEFENAVYGKFLILTKKRYMWLEVSRDGILSDKIGKKGVLLARRDVCNFVRDMYENTTTSIFNHVDTRDILYSIVQKFNECMSSAITYKEFIITKQVGDKDSYKKKELTDDPIKRAKRLRDLNCSVQEFHEKSLPAPVQLAHKMRRRGIRVEPGDRIDYVITGPPKAKLFAKLEDPVYQQKYGNIIRIDYLYYIHLSSQLDQLLEVAFGIKNFVKSQHKLRMSKMKVLKQLQNLHQVELHFE